MVDRSIDAGNKMNEIATMPFTGKSLEEFVVRGNLAALSSQDKAAHYIALCQSLGLNPASKPFAYINMQGKEVLYALRDCTDQLRKIHTVSIEIVARDNVDDLYIVTARATLPNGRRDESTGAVSISGQRGDNLANLIMKAETKAKRRVTLSVCGLGMLDESELETVQIDRFANLRPEATVAATSPKPVETLPEPPEHIAMIPAMFLKAYKQLAHLDGVALVDMPQEDLELVVETFKHGYEARKAKGNTSETALSWMRAIIADATQILNPVPK